MVRRLLPVVTLAAVTAVALVGIDGLTYAATGHSLILGHVNKSKAATTITRTKAGPPLVLKSKHGSPPLKVSSSTQVKHLNASEVGGLKAAALQGIGRTYYMPDTTGLPDATSWKVALPQQPAGAYQVSYTVSMATHATTTCFLSVSKSNNYILLAYGLNDGGFTTSSSTGVIKVHKGQPLALYCASNSDADFVQTGADGDHSEISFIPLGGDTATQLTTASVVQQ